MFADSKTLRLAIISSLIFHALLALFFFFIRVGFDFHITEFTEIAFSSGKASVEPLAYAPAHVEPVTAKTEKSETASEIIKLPQRQMLEKEETPLKVVDQGEKLSSNENEIIPQKSNFDKEEKSLAEDVTKAIPEEKETVNINEGLFADAKILPTITPTKLEGIGEQTPYEIEGKAASRIVAYRVIPEYPANLQKQAVVKISFTVLANGQVGEMLPQIKADADLEKITMDALRQWRFNPLPEHEEQRVERGVITFRYLLK